MSIEALYKLFISCGMDVSTDSRNIAKEQLFIALKGENFNGNLFAKEALEKGASFVVVDEGEHDDERIVKVENTLLFLQDLARCHRRHMPAKILGIGGSNGKTSTKELLVSVLGLEKKIHFTSGNFNNHIGLPLTLLKLRKEHEIAVIEMGANKVGDIEELALIAEPDMGLITNIGKEHLEGFGDIEGVAKAESELFDYLLKHKGHAFVNTDDKWLNNMGKRLINKTEYGMNKSGFSEIQTNPSIQFIYKGERIKSQLMGNHNLQNIMACCAVADYLGLNVSSVQEGVQKYAPSNNRSQWVHTASGNTILLDAYNANPSSVEAALHFFQETEGYKVVVLGDMFELGAYEASEHQNIGELCSQLNFDAVYLLGKAFSNINLKSNKNIHLFSDKAELRKHLQSQQFKTVKVLIKGSRGMKMEELQDVF